MIQTGFPLLVETYSYNLNYYLLTCNRKNIHCSLNVWNKITNTDMEILYIQVATCHVSTKCNSRLCVPKKKEILTFNVFMVKTDHIILSFTHTIWLGGHNFICLLYFVFSHVSSPFPNSQLRYCFLTSIWKPTPSSVKTRPLL